MTSWTSDPRRRVCSKPRPDLHALHALDAHDRRRQRRRRAAGPSGRGCRGRSGARGPPPRRRRRRCCRAPRASSIRAIIRASAPGSGQRSGLASVSSRVRVQASRSSATPPTSAVNDQTSIPSSARKARQTAPAATRAAVSRADARSRTGRTSSKPYLRAPARSAWPGRTRVTGWARSVALRRERRQLGRLLGLRQRLDLHDPRPVLPVAVAHQEQDRRADRPARAGPRPGSRARSCSIAWRAPRPYPPWRRRRSTAIASAVTGMPAGSPSSVAPSVGPCDSPAVRKRKPVMATVRPPAPRPCRPPRRRHPRAGARGRQPLGELLVHQVERGRLAGPQRERRRALVEEHRLAVEHLATGRLGVAQEARLRRVVDEVHDQEVGRDQLARDRRSRRRCRPTDGGVDEHLRLGQLGLDDRLVPGHRPQLHVGRAPGEEADHRLRPVEVAIEDHDPGEALGHEAVDDGAGAAAGAEDHRGAGHPLLADERVRARPGTPARRCCGRRGACPRG